MALPHPLVIAGPCSAETEEQVLEIAHALKDTDVNYYRAGIWKPRTRPGNFEGVGAIGLKWLQRVKEETGLTAKHWERILDCHVSNSVTDEAGCVFIAQELTEGEPEPDDSEDLQIRRLPLRDAVAMAMSGEILSKRRLSTARRVKNDLPGVQVKVIVIIPLVFPM